MAESFVARRWTGLGSINQSTISLVHLHIVPTLVQKVKYFKDSPVRFRYQPIITKFDNLVRRLDMLRFTRPAEYLVVLGECTEAVSELLVRASFHKELPK